MIEVIDGRIFYLGGHGKSFKNITKDYINFQFSQDKKPMIDLQKEAEDLADNESLFGEVHLSGSDKKLFIKGVHSGANSNYVQQQILQGKIDVLKMLSNDLLWQMDLLKKASETCKDGSNVTITPHYIDMLKSIKAEIDFKLKELQNEK